MFLLLVLSVIIVVGTFMINSVAQFYHLDFVKQVQRALADDFTQLLSTALSDPAPAQAISNAASVYSTRLGIDTYRNYYILDKMGEYITGSDSSDVILLEKSENIISAINGQRGEKVKVEQNYMDYAYPIKDGDGNTRYILYIRDSKEEIYEITRKIFEVVIQALLVGMLMAVILGFFMSKTITTPISGLTNKAEKLARGEFEHMIDVESKDEIGTLTNTFNYMASTLRVTLEEIASEKDKVETIIRCMNDGVMAFNHDGRVIHINPAAMSLLSIEDADSIEFDSFFHSIGVDIRLGQFLYLGVQNTIEKRVEFNGLFLMAYLAPFKVEKEKPGGVVVVWQDNTKRQKLDDVRKEFVANVSHELKTPLTTIKTYTEPLLDDQVEDKEMGIRFLTVINNEIDRMNRIVSDLLLLSRIDYSKINWYKTKFSIDNLIDEIVDKLSMEAKRHNHTMEYLPSTQLPSIVADRDRIEQLLTNVISNAVKYTPDGGHISIFAGHVRNEVYIKVQDNGIGIPKADLDRIFERFYRVDKARSRAYGGTGLGLSIAKEIVEAHNGSIAMESEPGKGTTVLIRLPV